MSEQIQGSLEILDNSSNVTITLSGTTGIMTVGGSGKRGIVDIRDAAGTRVVRLNGNSAHLRIGGTGNAGMIEISDAGDKTRVGIDGAKGDIWVKDAAGKTLMHFDSTYAAMWLGGHGNEGDLIVRDAANKERIKLDGGDGDIWVKDAAGKTLMHFDSTYAAMWLGGHGNEGDLIVRDAANKERIKLDGGDGDIWVDDSNGVQVFRFDSTYAALYLGGQNNEGDLIVRNNAGDQTIRLDGGSGDITLSNADAAEDFEVARPEEASAGSVMVLSDDGRLEHCTSAYDQKVVGVVSGAGQYRPGIVLDRSEDPDDRRVPISVMGKVACRADASYGDIRVGDLLTTSPTAGCAMKASDPVRSHGSTIGKALSTLEDGNGLITMLISLQ